MGMYIVCLGIFVAVLDVCFIGTIPYINQSPFVWYLFLMLVVAPLLFCIITYTTEGKSRVGLGLKRYYIEIGIALRDVFIGFPMHLLKQWSK